MQSQTLGSLIQNGLPELEHYDFSNAKEFTPRPIQIEAKQLLAEEYKKGNKHVVLSLSTGSGKTLLAAWLCKTALEKKPDQTIFFCVNRNALIVNAKHAFEELLGIKVGVIQGMSDLNLERQIQIVSLQTLENRLNEDKNKYISFIFKNLNVQMIFNDECHYNYNGLNSLLESFEDNHNYILSGLTATAYPAHLSKNYDSLVKPRTIRNQIEEGVLVDYKLLCHVEDGIDLKKLKTNASGEYTDKSAGEAIDEMLIAGDPAKAWFDDEDTRGRYTIIFCPSKASCEVIYDHFISSDLVPVDEIGIMHSSRSDEQNALTLHKCKTGEIRIVISVNMLREGVDLPHFSCGIDLQPLANNKSKLDEPNSITTYIQKYGRLIRSFKGAKKVKTEQGYELITGDTDLEIIEVIKPKEYAVIVDYTHIYRFASVIDIDERYTELQKEKEKKDLEPELLEAIEEKDLDKLLPPKIICPDCLGEIERPPQCGCCGYIIESVESVVVPELEIKFTKDKVFISHIPQKYKNKLKKREKERNKPERKNVDYKNLTGEQKVKVMAAVMEVQSYIKYKTEKTRNSAMYGMLIGVLGKEQMPSNGVEYNQLKSDAFNYFNNITKGNNYRDLQKYVSKVERERRKYFTKKVKI